MRHAVFDLYHAWPGFGPPAIRGEPAIRRCFARRVQCHTRPGDDCHDEHQRDRHFHGIKDDTFHNLLLGTTCRLPKLDPQQRRRDLIVSATIPEANTFALDLELYKEDGAGDPEPGGKLPDYTIMTTSRGCPFECAYCSANVLNEGRQVWVREYNEAYEEIKRRFRDGIREFCFYEDNLLLGRDNFTELIRLIAEDPELEGIELHAPEGIEVRLLHKDVVKLMRQAGFKKLYLPLETVNKNMAKSWARTHTNMDKFFYALENAEEAGFKPRCQDINCFILFGLPEEDLQAVYDTVVFASSHSLVWRLEWTT